MDLYLVRKQYREDGVFGVLQDFFANEIALTLEHSYPGVQPGTYRAKIPAGNYTCVLGSHRLEGMAHPFSTYQVMDVPGHSNILFHWGNYNSDSDGCVLLGESIGNIGNRPQMITNSKKTFEKFMELQKGNISFKLIVEG